MDLLDLLPSGPPRQPTRTTAVANPNQVVLFADMLGFATLTKAHPIDMKMLSSRVYSLSLEQLLSISDNPLTTAFAGFHSALSAAISMAEQRHPLTAITFSDSAFIATDYLFQATTLAADVARSMIRRSIPVRMGMAFGSFAALRFRSDISSDGGDHAAQFLGAAVVNAYEAERCGIKGLRILLHPTIKPLLGDSAHNPTTIPFGNRPIRLLELNSAEQDNKAGINSELDYWDLPITEERKGWRNLQDMWLKAPEPAKNHYEATAAAIDRMRIARCEAPLTSLRQRTLPPRRHQASTKV
jgi:hypothetical protein